MNHLNEPHDPQESATEAIGRRPWKAPRLIDLDDLDADCGMGVGAIDQGADKIETMAVEFSRANGPFCTAVGPGTLQVAS